VSFLTVRPDRFVAGGDVLARDDDGRVVFVRGALPGETVAVEVTAAKKDWARADVVDVVEPSPDRVVPPCPSRRAGCGGCGWQHLSLGAQRAARLAIVSDALRRIGGVGEPEVVDGGGVEPEGYRTTVRVAAGPDGRAGFRAERSHEVVPAPACLVAHPVLAELLPELRLAPGVEATLRTSVATGELNARWTGGNGEGEAIRGLPVGTATGVAAAIREDVAGHRLRVSMGSFFQSGPQAAELLVTTIRRIVPELAAASLVVDAYAGVGVLAVCATEPASRIVAVETSRAAVADARDNLSGREAEVVRGEVGGWRLAADVEVDVVIADPARSGLGRPGVGALTRTGSPVLVLVSCDPASLGRDAKLLAAAGYRHERTEVVDTFPHTTHVEAVTRFVQR
jgi:23S rRNA (uracil1939-C5)-methyltransferase